MIYDIAFSCTGTTSEIAFKIAMDLAGIGNTVRTIDLLEDLYYDRVIENVDDVVVFAVPVWGGRVPAMAVNNLRLIKGNGQKAVAVVVYGNRDYDDALLELCDIATEQGFSVVSAAAFVAEHCIFPTVATARPDASDQVAISQFINETKAALASGSVLDMSKVKGNRPYKKYGGVPLHPMTDTDACVKCLYCTANCPTDAINSKTLETDADKCITCCRCIAKCKNGARKFGGVMYKTVKFGFEKMYSKRREPELFF